MKQTPLGILKDAAESPWGGDYAMAAVSRQLADDLTKDLKARVMAIVEPQVDEAVAAIVRAYNIQTHAARSYADMATHVVFGVSKR